MPAAETCRIRLAIHTHSSDITAPQQWYHCPIDGCHVLQEQHVCMRKGAPASAQHTGHSKNHLEPQPFSKLCCARIQHFLTNKRIKPWQHKPSDAPPAHSLSNHLLLIQMVHLGSMTDCSGIQVWFFAGCESQRGQNKRTPSMQDIVKVADVLQTHPEQRQKAKQQLRLS